MSDREDFCSWALYDKNGQRKTWRKQAWTSKDFGFKPAVPFRATVCTWDSFGPNQDRFFELLLFLITVFTVFNTWNSDSILILTSSAFKKSCKAHIECPYGKKVEIIKAEYGRWNDYECRGDFKKIKERCDESHDRTSSFKRICDGQENCKIVSNNYDAEIDICPEISKYFQINWICV